MSVNLPNWYARQYSTNIQLKLQAMGSLLRPYVTEGRYVGDQASPVDFMGSVEMQDVTQRFAPTGRVDAATDRRGVPRRFRSPADDRQIRQTPIAH